MSIGDRNILLMKEGVIRSHIGQGVEAFNVDVLLVLVKPYVCTLLERPETPTQILTVNIMSRGIGFPLWWRMRVLIEVADFVAKPALHSIAI